MLRNKILIYILMLTSIYGATYLAVIDLEPTGVTDTEAKVLTQTLTSKMIELSDYIVVERANIDKILKEQKFQHSGCTDSECAVEIGQLLNADITVIGTAGKVGSTYTLQTRIINVESGEALKSADYTHKGEIDELLSEGVEYVAHKLLGIPYQKKIKSKSSSGYGATLDIQSNPAGAEIYIGGNYFETTPLILEDFPAGKYEISIKLTNYKDYTESVTLQPRGNSKISADLLCMHSIDCAGICNGDNIEDNCGTCDTDSSNDCAQDCAGTWGGNLVNDECGICNGPGAISECGCNDIPEGDCDCKGSKIDCEGVCGGSNFGLKDECGVCNGDNSSCSDCAGIPNGDAVVDDCGICDGNNFTCTPYTKSEIIYTTLGILLFVYSIISTQ